MQKYGKYIAHQKTKNYSHLLSFKKSTTFVLTKKWQMVQKCQ